MKYKPVIGLEVHVELKTKSKMFCSCKAEYFGEKPNTHVCPVCLGLPGALPVPNKKAIEWCVMIGQALNCKIPLVSKFDRKNYFYPDLAKGYQISQYDEPFCVNGSIVIANEVNQSHTIEIASSQAPRNDKKQIRVRRVHMEEDTAKLMHQFGTQNSKLKTQNHEGYSLIDFNRSGIPLVEIVTEPDFENSQQVVEYLKRIQQIVRYLDVSNADMEKGEMRLEPNISLKPVIRDAGQASMTKDRLPPYKIEVKNINSFKFVEKAINFEIERQRKILDSGKNPAQETRGWDSVRQITVSQRAKEEAQDYRYFPEPDIPPIRFTQSQIAKFKTQIPELPDQKLIRFQKDFGLSVYDAEILTRENEAADYFEEAVRMNHQLRIMNQGYAEIKTIANWIINKKVDLEKTLPAGLIQLIISSSKVAVIDDKKLEAVIKSVLLENTKAVTDYKNGKVQVIGFLLGKVKQHFPKGDTNQIKTVLEKYLK